MPTLSIIRELTLSLFRNRVYIEVMKVKLVLGILLLFVFSFALSPPAFAIEPPIIVGANLNAYTPPTGTECNINVPSQYSTIQAGIDASSNGDTVCVGPGTYNEDVVVNKTVKLSGSGRLQSTIIGQNPVGISTLLVTGTNSIVEGFFIRGVGTAMPVQLAVNNPTFGATIQYNWIKAGNGGWVIYAGFPHNLIQNNVIEGDNSPYGVRAVANTNILNNTFIGTIYSGSRSDDGITVTADANSLVKQNVFNTSGQTAALIASNNSVVTENNFNSDTLLKVSGYPAINAQNNWWGDTDPSDNVGGVVDYSNFALVPFQEYRYNQPPVVRKPNSATIAAGAMYNSTTYFIDSDSSSWTATVDYGDGSGVQPLVLSGKTFSLSHIYQNIGTYSVTVTVTDDQNETGTETATITVNDSGITVGANLYAYVQPTGGQCNINVPAQYSTIQAGINAANWGDTVCVGLGTYNEDVVINKPIRLSGSGVGKSIINGLPGWPGPILISASNVIIEGFLIHGPPEYYDVVQIGEARSGITLRYNWMVSGNGGDVLFTGRSLNNVLIQNNVLEGNNSHHLAYVSPSNTVDFLNNTFMGTVNDLGGDTGIVIDNRAPSSSIKQNTFNTTGTTRGLISTNVNVMVNENNFNSDTLLKIFGHLGPLMINAENNWWGDTNPSDNISRDVDFSPFALSPFPEYSLDQAPTVQSVNGATINEGDTYNTSGSFIDSDSTSWTANVDYGDGFGAQPLTLSGTNFSLSHIYKDNGIYTITVSVTDEQGAVGIGTANVVVDNVAPTIGTITAPSTPVQVNTAVTASSSFTDPGVLDTHTASWDWGDGNITSATVTESNGSGSVSDSHTYTAAGVYTIMLTVTDKDTGTSTQTFQYISVYNPTPQGLFTGNRIFSSPVGAYLQNPNLTGQVQFGVTSKYQDTSLIGKVSMNFKAANLEFDSTSLTVLVTSDGQATLRGTGTINGSGNYNFLVTGLDGTQDAIRFQIKDQSETVIYDSQLGSPDTSTPTTSVTGQVIIH